MVLALAQGQNTGVKVKREKRGKNKKGKKVKTRKGMAQDKRYDNLLALPLFLGMSRDDLQKAAGQTRFDFRKIEPNTVIAAKGDPCSHLYFLLDGKVKVQTCCKDNSYSMEETLTPPDAFQPERLFGLHQHFTHTYTALTPCSLLCITKQEALQLSTDFIIFRINLLNLISTQSQRYNWRTLQTPPLTLDERIARFFSSLCIRPEGEKTLHITMRRLALENNDTRINVSRALNRLQARGLLRLQRGRITVPSMENLRNAGFGK